MVQFNEYIFATSKTALTFFDKTIINACLIPNDVAVISKTIYSLKQRKDMKKIFLLAFLALFMIRAFAQPSTAAPTPTTSLSQVMSLFGDTYTNVAGTDWRPDWGQATALTNLTVGGASTLEYSGLTYEGVQFASNINAAAMDSIHFDVWTADCTTLNFFLINTDTHVQISVPITPTLSGWTSVTLPLSDYSAVGVDDIGQLMFTGNGTIYVQNVYFSNAVGKPTISGFSIPAQTLGSSTYTITDPTSNSTGAFTYSSSNTAVATVDGNTITIVGIGNTVITASQAADSNYSAGTAVSTLVVGYPGPASAAPIPTTNSTYTLSLYGNAYTNVAGTSWFPNWGQSTQINTPTIGGKSTLQYTNLNYEGVAFASDVDASAMDSIHLDIWSPNVTSLTIGLIKITGGTVRQDVTVALTTGGWNYISIPLTSYNTVDLSKIGQMIFVGNTPTTGGVIYLQNIYFVNAVGKPTLSGFSIPTQTYGVNSTYTLNPTSNSTGAITYSSSNTSVATISGNVITIVGAGTSTITATEVADSSYSAGTFTTLLTVDYAGPSTAAAVPTSPSLYTLSLWGNAYTNVAGTDWYPNWGQSTQYATPTIGGKSTIKYSALNYQGVQFAGNVDASLMDSLRLNIWTPNCTSLQIFLINTYNGVEQPYTLSLTTNGWNNVSIPLAAYNSIDLSKIGQIKIVAVTPSSGAVIYLQNIYFMNVVGKPTITGFSIPTQTLGTATYTITNPTSTSTGAFTYTSSNTSVATISGHTITIKGVGTSTITATEAADDNNLSGSVTTILTVAYPGPTTAAAVPTALSSLVTSLWGNTYTNVSGTTWNPIWGQNPAVTTTTLTVVGKTTLEYSSLTYEGVQFSNPVNVSTKNLLHFDLWTPNCTSFDFYLINTDAGGVNQMVTVTPTINGWNSINIPLSNFTTQVINNINQIKIVATTPSSNAVLYFQNIYFVSATPTWAGTVSSDYSVASNWQYGLAPTNTNSIIIPASLTNEPVLSSNVTLAGITLNGTLDLNGKSLNLNGAITGSGSLKGNASSSLVIAGTVGTLNFASNANNLQNLTITSGSVTLGNALNVYGTFTPTAGTITTSGNLTLKSTSIANTAVVGVVGGTVSGTVTVERFIPSGLRTYRDLGAEVSNAGTIFNNWQEGGVNTNGYGIQITGATGSSIGTDAGTGFDYSLTGNHSLFTYLNNSWDSIANTNSTTLNPYQGYRVLVRGNRTNNLQVSNPVTTPVTIRSKGNLVTGNVNFSNLTSGSGNYSFVANPYVSPVLWSSVVSASTGINGTYWYCDPTFTDSGYTTFVAFNNINGVSNPLGHSQIDGYLQPGQAFFVQNATSSPSLRFTEACKVPAQSKTAIFGISTPINRIAVGLNRNGSNVDGAVTAFGSSFSNAIGTEDAIKFPNAAENIAFTVGAKDLSINGTSMPSASVVLPIHIYNLFANSAYTLRLDVSQYNGNGVQAYVKDNVLKTTTLLSGNNTSISFATHSVDAASYANRYSIVFGAGLLPVTDIRLTATAQVNGVQVAWTTVGESNVANYSAQHSIDGVTFSDIATVSANNSANAAYSVTDSKAVSGSNYYRIKVSSNDGTVSFSNVASVTVGKASTSIAAYPNPLVGNTLKVALNNLEAGKYSVSVYNVLGEKVVAKSITHVGGTSVQQLSINSHLAAGTYTVHVSNANGVSYQSQIEVK